MHSEAPPFAWFDDYLADNPPYRADNFRKFFRVPLKLYHVIHNRLILDHPTLGQQVEGLGKPGHTSHQKILAGLLRLGQPSSSRELDDDFGSRHRTASAKIPRV